MVNLSYSEFRKTANPAYSESRLRRIPLIVRIPLARARICVGRDFALSLGTTRARSCTTRSGGTPRRSPTSTRPAPPKTAACRRLGICCALHPRVLRRVRVVALHGVACELQRCTQRSSSSGSGPSGSGPSGHGPSGSGPSGNGPSGIGPSGNGPSGNGVIAGGGARAEQRRLFAQPRVLAAQRSPVKARHVPAARHVRAGTALVDPARQHALEDLGTRGGTRVLRLGRAGRLPQCGGAGTPRRSPTSLRHSRCARRTRRCRRRAWPTTAHSRTGRCSVGYSQ